MTLLLHARVLELGFRCLTYDSEHELFSRANGPGERTYVQLPPEDVSFGWTWTHKLHKPTLVAYFSTVEELELAVIYVSLYQGEETAR